MVALFSRSSSLALVVASISAFAAASGCGSSGNTTGDGASLGPTGLPCEIQALLADQCTSCHSHPPVGGAPSPLVTRDDLLATSRTMPGKTLGEAALARMQSTTAPMPPTGAPPAADVAAFETWVKAGMPEGSCATNPDEPVCTSEIHWKPLDEGAPEMNPGRACVSCHQQDPEAEAPLLVFGGTVYTTKHEPDLCLGGSTTPGDIVKVEITDANGKILELPVNSSGNFFAEAETASVVMPYSARVLKNGQARAMSAKQTSGDCNACHTQDGANGAPGRIMMP